MPDVVNVMLMGGLRGDMLATPGVLYVGSLVGGLSRPRQRKGCPDRETRSRPATSFTDGLDGGFPSGGVTFDGAGNLFGETYDGGSFACPESGCGVVYKLTPTSKGWKFSVAHTFNGRNGSKGSQPSGGLAFDGAGNLYGTTGNGGNLSCNNGNGCGTIFELSPKSKSGFTFSLIYAFDGPTGANPTAGVIVDAAENLYGTTFAGGTGNCELTGCGVAFALTP
jgi:uncharacterized repeat protein (TIGR03803 family)